MTVVYPEGTPTLGNTKIAVMVACANLAAPKLATEINAVTSVDGSCYIYPAGWAPTATTNKGTKPARLCSKKQAEQFNRTSYTFGDLQYVHDPQANDAATGNEMRELLVEGAKLYFVERQGLDAETDAFTVAEQVIVHYLEMGPQIRSGDRTDENGEFFITQAAVYVNDGPVNGVIAT